MYKVGLKILNEISNHNFEAYIVGGFARNMYLGKSSNDIDITTNAKPFEIQTMFPIVKLPNLKYGAVSIITSDVNLELTTYRKDLEYDDHRHPSQVEYTDSLFEDLLRRDFVMNTLCLDKDGNYIDLLGARSDIDARIIRTIKEPVKSFTEDVLRILRAIRFATVLYFEITEETKAAIIKTKHLLKEISYNRKKEELNKIFACPNKKYGLKLIKSLGLANELEIDISNVVVVDDPLAMWYQIDAGKNYSFSKQEINIFEQLKKASTKDLEDNYNLYKTGLYISTLLYSIKRVNTDNLIIRFKSLPIYKSKDLMISAIDLLNNFKSISERDISKIYDEIAKEIIYLRINNDFESIFKYLKQKY